MWVRIRRFGRLMGLAALSLVSPSSPSPFTASQAPRGFTPTVLRELRQLRRTSGAMGFEIRDAALPSVRPFALALAYGTSVGGGHPWSWLPRRYYGLC